MAAQVAWADVLDALELTGHARVHLEDCHAHPLRAPIHNLRTLFRSLPRLPPTTHLTAHGSKNEGSMAPLTVRPTVPGLTSNIDIARHEERCQIRHRRDVHTHCHGSQAGTEPLAVVSELHKSHAQFKTLAFTCLARCKERVGSRPSSRPAAIPAQLIHPVNCVLPDIDADTDTARAADLAACYDDESECLDVFFYERSNKKVPCPAHLDPGLITLLVDDHAGVEVLNPVTQEWSGPIVLGGDEVLILANRALDTLSGGAFKACRHRVVDTSASSDRVSMVYEVKQNAHGLREANRLVSERLSRSSRSSGGVAALSFGEPSGSTRTLSMLGDWLASCSPANIRTTVSRFMIQHRTHHHGQRHLQAQTAQVLLFQDDQIDQAH